MKLVADVKQKEACGYGIGKGIYPKGKQQVFIATMKDSSVARKELAKPIGKA